MRELTTMRVTDLMAAWRPGSFDAPWTWADEARDLAERGCCCRSQMCAKPFHLAPGEYQAKVVARVEAEGIGYADDFAPILLGNDGRVWDGHHRLVAARHLKIYEVKVEVIPPERDEGTAA